MDFAEFLSPNHYSCAEPSREQLLGIVTRKSQQRILIVRLGSLGDILHSLPALAALKESFPEWEMDWLVERRWRPLLEGIPLVSRILELDTLAWRREPFSPRVWSALRRAIQALRERRYDGAVDLQASLKSAAACYLSEAREIIGFDKPWLKEPACAVFYTRRIATGAVHIVEANLALAAALGARATPACFPLPPGDPQSLPADLPPGGLAVLNPGAGWPAKRWPPENYAVVCDRLETDFSLPTVLNCGPDEEELAHQVRRACRRSAPRVYRGNLPGLIALLRRSRLMVGPDTGPVHLAAALGVPTVGLFGPTDPRRNGPYGPHTRLLRPDNATTSYRHSSASADLMRQIQPEAVIAAIRELFTESPTAENHPFSSPDVAATPVHAELLL